MEGSGYVTEEPCGCCKGKGGICPECEGKCGPCEMNGYVRVWHEGEPEEVRLTRLSEALLHKLQDARNQSVTYSEMLNGLALLSRWLPDKDEFNRIIKEVHNMDKPSFEYNHVKDEYAEPRSTGIAGEILDERRRQDKKWGEQNHGLCGWIAILTEEVGEAAREACDYELNNDPIGENTLDRYREELIQVAAVAIAAIECLDRKRFQELQKQYDSLPDASDAVRAYSKEMKRVIEESRHNPQNSVSPDTLRRVPCPACADTGKLLHEDPANPGAYLERGCPICKGEPVYVSLIIDEA